MAMYTQHTRGWLQDVDQALQEYRSEHLHKGTSPQDYEDVSIQNELQHIEEEFRTAKHHLRNWRTHPVHLWNTPQIIDDDDEGEESCIVCEECLNLPYQQEKALHRCKRRLARYDHLKTLFQEMVREGKLSDDVPNHKNSGKLYATDAR